MYQAVTSSCTQRSKPSFPFVPFPQWNQLHLPFSEGGWELFLCNQTLTTMEMTSAIFLAVKKYTAVNHGGNKTNMTWNIFSGRVWMCLCYPGRRDEEEKEQGQCLKVNYLRKWMMLCLAFCAVVNSVLVTLGWVSIRQHNLLTVRVTEECYRWIQQHIWVNIVNNSSGCGGTTQSTNITAGRKHLLGP